MTVLVKKVFISSKPSIVCLLCPPPCGPFSIQQNAKGGLSYKVKKNELLRYLTACCTQHPSDPSVPIAILTPCFKNLEVLAMPLASFVLEPGLVTAVRPFLCLCNTKQKRC